jgi:acetyltransferase
MSSFGLERIFAPKSVALVGGSPRPSSLGTIILRNIVEGGFRGKIAVVNPEYASIGGQRTDTELKALPFVPDLIVVTAPAPAIPGIIAEAGERGVAGAVIISSGLGHGPGSIAEAVAQSARIHKMRIIGPNCLGVMFPRVDLNASFAARHPARGPLALISQSGAIAAAMVDWGAEKSVGFSGIVSIGDQIDVDVADLLDYFALDEKTRAILLYIEAVSDARKFMSAARAAARLKPVVVVKSGRMAQGAKAAATHTGALAGSDAVYDAAFRRAGLLRVMDLRELFDCAELLGRHVHAPGGKKLSILTNGGGLGILAVDRLAELGGSAPALTAEVSAKLDAVLPPTWSKANPVDIAGDADANRYLAALDVLLADPSSDAVLVMNVETAVAPAAGIAEAVAERIKATRAKAGTFAKPVLAAWVGTDQSVAPIFDKARIPHFPTEDDAVRAFMNLVKHREATEALMATPPNVSSLFTPDVNAARKIVSQAWSEGREWLDPVEIAALFEAYSIPMVPTVAANDPDDAVAKAETFLAQGQPVAVKILSRDITHKSDVGGVVLGLTTKGGVRSAACDVIGRAKRARPDARIQGVMIQPMIARPAARELILGIADDPTFGPVVVFGRGGTAVEIVKDKALALPPLDMNLARDLIDRTVVARLLSAYRDVPAVPSDVVPLTLIKLFQMAADCPEIHELDINPLLADETGVLALDARVAIRKPVRLFAGQTRFAIRPYPSQWEGQLVLRNGWPIAVRPMRPDDEPAVIKFLGQVWTEDLRLRFFHAVKEFSHQFVGRLTQLDYARSMAFVALDKETGEITGVARLHSDSRYESAEYAILVRSNLKGNGLGWALMQLLIDYATAEGLKSLYGQVLAENTTMLTMCRELGFDVKTDPSEAGIMLVSLDLKTRSFGANDNAALVRKAMS